MKTRKLKAKAKQKHPWLYTVGKTDITDVAQARLCKPKEQLLGAMSQNHSCYDMLPKHIQ